MRHTRTLHPDTLHPSASADGGRQPMFHGRSQAGIPWHQVSEVARLVAEVAHWNIPPPLRRRMLMEGLKGLVDADAWLWSTRCYDLGKDRPAQRNVLHDGLNKVQLGGWINGHRDANDGLPEAGPPKEGSPEEGPPEEGPPEEGPLATLAMMDEHFHANASGVGLRRRLVRPSVRPGMPAR